MFNLFNKRFVVALGAAATLTCAACGGDTSGPNCVVALDKNTFPSSTLSFATHITPIFVANKCNTALCHGGNPPASAHSTLSVEGTMNGGTVSRSQGKCGVVRGDPATSYLVTKLESAGISGVRMPEGEPPLGQADIDTIKQWIREGAHP